MPRLAKRNTRGSLNFNGTTSVVTLPTSINSNFITVSAWFKLDPTELAGDIVDKYQGVSTRSWSLGYSTNAKVLVFSVSLDGATNNDVNSPTLPAMNDGVWRHAVGTYDRTNSRVYLNGVLMTTSGTLSGTIFNTAIGPKIGPNVNTLQGAFTGNVQGVRIWNRALSDTEVSNLYTYETMDRSTLIGEWLLNNITGTTAPDTSGNSLNGTATNTTASTDTPFLPARAVQDIKSALQFPSTNAGYVTIPNSSGQVIGASDNMSVFLRFFQKSTPAGTNYLFAIPASAGNNRRYIQMLSTGTLAVNVGSTNPAISGVIPLGEWQSVLLSVDVTNSLFNVYRNGQLVIAQAWTPGTGIADIIIGNSATAGGQGSFADISDVRLFNRALTQTEAENLHYFSANPTTGFVDSWMGDDGVGSIVYSKTGNNNGTSSGITYTSNTPCVKRRTDQVGGNLVKNGDFSYVPRVNVPQTVTAKYLDGTAGGSASVNRFSWAVFQGSGTFGAMFDTSVQLNGRNTMKISAVSAGATVDVDPIINSTVAEILDKCPPILPNTTYTLTYSLKTNKISGDGNGAYVTISERTGVAGTALNTDTTKINTTTDWTTYSTTFTTTSTSRFMLLRLTVSGQGSTADLIMDAWFANISLTVASPILSSRPNVGGNLVRNDTFRFFPTSNVATTTSSRWLTGAAAGSTTQSEYSWGTYLEYTGGVLIDTSTTYNGNNSIKVFTSAVAPSGVHRVGATTLANASLSSAVSAGNDPYKVAYLVDPNTSYTVSFYVKTDSVTNTNSQGARVFILTYSGGFTTTTAYTSSVLTGTNDWTLVTGTFITNSTAVFCSVECGIRGEQGTAWFTKISLVKTTDLTRTIVT